jgi:hypothetical protein
MGINFKCAVGKIYPEFAFFLKGNLHDAWKSDKSNGVTVRSAKQPERRRRWCLSFFTRFRSEEGSSEGCGSFVILLCDG